MIRPRATAHQHAQFKLDAPERVACLSLRYQVAQKLHAVTERPPDRPNQGYWDLIDLILLRDLLSGDLGTTRAACVEIFAGRATHSWPPELIVPAAWREPYRVSAQEIDADLPADMDAAADDVRLLVTQIDTWAPPAPG